MTSQTQIRLKLLAALVALGCGVGAIVVVVQLYRSTPAATSTPSAPQTAAPASAATLLASDTSSFPSPPSDALVLAREDRDLAVGLAVSPRGGRIGLQASILGPDRPASGLSVSFVAGRERAAARPCGAGCYAASIASPAPRSVQVSIRGPGRAPSTVAFALPASVPGASAVALVRRAETSWRRLITLVDHSRLSSGPSSTIFTVWHFQAPYRYTYVISNGAQAVSIGPRRWDSLRGQAWQRSEQDPIREPIPLWESVSNAHVLGATTLHGRPAVAASFFDPQLDAWFTLWLDPATLHTLELRMTAESHFMHEVYGPFDAPLRIVPPAKAGA